MVGGRGLAGGAEKVKAERQQTGPLAISEKAKMPNADEAAGKRVEQEAAQELVQSQAQQSLFIFVSGVPPAKCDLTVAEGYQSAVRDGDAVSVSAEIPDDVLGPLAGLKTAKAHCFIRSTVSASMAESSPGRGLLRL